MRGMHGTVDLAAYLEVIASPAFPDPRNAFLRGCCSCRSCRYYLLLVVNPPGLVKVLL